MTKRIQLGKGIYLNLIQTDKFKSNLLSYYLIRPLDREEVTKNALLPSVLKRGNMKFSTNLEIEKEEFFQSFFADGGKYMKFVSVSNDGAVAAGDRMKIGKEYKIGVVVSVSVANLRKDFEESGIIKSLGAGFN